MSAADLAQRREGVPRIHARLAQVGEHTLANHHRWQIAAMHILTTRAVRPRIYLLRRALHPIRRHYTPSVRVQRHVTGAAPRNGCSASGSSPAHQSTRNGDNAEVFLKRVGNYRGQPRQRFRASHRPADGHHSCLSTSSTGERSQGHRTTGGWLQHHGFRRMEAVNEATAGTNTPFERSVASLGTVTSRLADRPPGPRPSHPAPRPPRPGRRPARWAGPRLDLSVAPRAPDRRRAPGQASRSPVTRLQRPRQGQRSDRRGAPSTAPPRARRTRQRR